MADGTTREVAKLRWRCRRGMHELDGVLEAFLDRRFAALSSDEKARFAAILDLPDPELYAYLAGRAVPPDGADAAIFEAIRQCLRPEA